MSSELSTPVIGGVFRFAVPVRWGDLDAQNHVNNTLYFRYIEEARVQLFRQAGMGLGVSKVGLLAHIKCDFLKPVLYPATVVVHLVLTRIGRTSMAFDTVIECQHDPGVAYAQGENVIVGADVTSGRPAPWTPSELDALAACFVK